MNELMSYASPFLAGGVALLVMLIGLVWVSLRRAMIRQGDYFRQQLRHSDKEQQKASKQLLEVRSVVVGLGKTVNDQQEIIKHLNDRLKELENADTDARLYSRASKMVKLGADLDELIEECELPKAELMMSLQKKLQGKEAIPPLASHPEGKARVVPNRPPVRKQSR
ncbi:DUF2802 domain-containing protein [Vibrio diazotrophicus]|nr:DUF2802 domain-containing protein [Vibrio diazotrophicus]NIY93684.1 DUF2802 domain-containing protein [Vibrio diazotrophicus]